MIGRGLLLLLLFVRAALAVELPATAEEALDTARRLERGKDVAKMVDYYRAILERWPDHGLVDEVRFRLGKGLEDLGRHDEAMRQYATAIERKDPGFRHRADALYRFGRLQSQNRDPQAAETLELLLKEGAGANEDEVRFLLAGIYVMRDPPAHEDAAAHLQLLRNSTDRKVAEEAAIKLCVMWMKVQQVERARREIEELHGDFPRCEQIPYLLLQLAGTFQQLEKPDRALAVCHQLAKLYPKTEQARIARYVQASLLRDRKRYDEALAELVELSRDPRNLKLGLAAEAAYLAAVITSVDLGKPDEAIPRFEEAGTLARTHGGTRGKEIMEASYLQLAEYYYRKEKWSVALEWYLQLRSIKPQNHYLHRITAIMRHLEDDDKARIKFGERDYRIIEQRIEENQGTAVALECELFLAGVKFEQAVDRRRDMDKVIGLYEDILERYPAEVQATEELGNYARLQLGLAHGHLPDANHQRQALALFEGIAAREESAYLIPALEGVARCAVHLKDHRKAHATFDRLYRLTGDERVLERSAQRVDDARRLEYFVSWVSATGGVDELLDQTMARLEQAIAEKPGTPEARHAAFYLAELRYMKKDWRGAAATYKKFVATYGPKQDAKGEVAGGPWRPRQVDDDVRQVYEAAVRVAHCWLMEGHHQLLKEAYEWMARNLPHQNFHLAEAKYWLAMELAKGADKDKPERRRQLAERLWRDVVHPSLDFGDRNFAKTFHPWVRHGRARDYVKTAILKSGRTFSELGEHGFAAEIFRQFLVLFPPPRHRHRRGQPPIPLDEKYALARFSLGKEYAALDNTDELLRTYQPFLAGERDDELRVSSLLVMGQHCTKAERWPAAIEAWQILLEEYGPPNPRDERKRPIPVPQERRLRHGKTNWNGLRLPPPEHLDQARVRYALGFVYWQQRRWRPCRDTLAPFLDDPALAKSRLREKALFMAGQAAFRDGDFARAAAALRVLGERYPRAIFIEESRVWLARAHRHLGEWQPLLAVCDDFRRRWPESSFLTRIQLEEALGRIGSDDARRGESQLKQLADGTPTQDVKADAAYHLALRHLAARPPREEEARRYLELSLDTFARAPTCISLARCRTRQDRWDDARRLAERALRDFPEADAAVRAEAKQLREEILAEIAKRAEKREEER